MKKDLSHPAPPETSVSAHGPEAGLDPVTHANDRRFIEAKLKEEVRRARRDTIPFAVLLVDVDYFKLYNKTLGHIWGDRLLRRISEIISGRLQSMDTFGRYALDAFVVILPGRDIRKGEVIARDFQKSILSESFPGAEVFDEIFPTGRLTVSIGVTAYHTSLEHESELLAWADLALYRAKRLGRARVEAQDGPPHGSEARRQPLKLFESLATIYSKAAPRDEKLQQTAHLVQQWLQIDVCSLYLLEKGHLVLRATIGLDPESVGTVRMSPREGLTGLAIETLTTICVRDAAKHPRFKYFPETGEERYGSYLGAPILFENAPVGVVVIQTRAGLDFTEEEVTVVKTVAGFLGGFLRGPEFTA